MRNFDSFLGNLTDEETSQLLRELLPLVQNPEAVEIVLGWAKDENLTEELLAGLEAGEGNE